MNTEEIVITCYIIFVITVMAILPKFDMDSVSVIFIVLMLLIIGCSLMFIIFLFRSIS